MKHARNIRFITQAGGYVGTPHRIARCGHRGESHVIIENKLLDGSCFYLNWIGAEYADEPDEYEEMPFKGLKWTAI
jgi:hypothetical protein